MRIRPHCRDSVEKTLSALGVQQLDLLLMHWPDAWVPGSDKEPDTSVTLEETWWVQSVFQGACLQVCLITRFQAILHCHQGGIC